MRPEGSFNAGGAKCGGYPLFFGSVMLGSIVFGSVTSSYGMPAYSNARRTYSPRPGISGHCLPSEYLTHTRSDMYPHNTACSLASSAS